MKPLLERTKFGTRHFDPARNENDDNENDSIGLLGHGSAAVLDETWKLWPKVG
jgi:hypothetical protein